MLRHATVSTFQELITTTQFSNLCIRATMGKAEEVVNFSDEEDCPDVSTATFYCLLFCQNVLQELVQLSRVSQSFVHLSARLLPHTF